MSNPTTQTKNHNYQTNCPMTTIPWDNINEPGTYVCNWSGHLLRVGIGGTIMFIGLYHYLYIIAKTAWSKKAEKAVIEIPVSESIQDPQDTPLWLDRWVPWLIGTIALLIIAYGPQLIDQISNIALTSPGFRVW